MSTVTIASASTPAVAFTPSLTFGGAATGMTYSTRSGIYIPFGDLVWFKLDIGLSAKGSSTGSAKVSVPFAGASDGHGAVSVGYGDALTSIAGGLAAFISSGTALIELYQLATGTAAALTNANFGNSSRLIISGVYSV